MAPLRCRCPSAPRAAHARYRPRRGHRRECRRCPRSAVGKPWISIPERTRDVSTSRRVSSAGELNMFRNNSELGTRLAKTVSGLQHVDESYRLNGNKKWASSGLVGGNISQAWHKAKQEGNMKESRALW